MKRSYCHIWCTWMLSLPCESSHETSSVGAFFVSSCHLTLRSSCHTFCIVSLLCGLSCVINSPDPEKLNLYCRSTLMTLSVIWWREAIVTFGALECFSPVWVLFSWRLWVLSCFSKSPDPENLLAHFEQKKCFSLVWFSHFSSIHLILWSSCLTLCTIVSLL